MTKNQSNLIAHMLIFADMYNRILLHLASGRVAPDQEWSSVEDLVQIHSEFDSCLDVLCDEVSPF